MASDESSSSIPVVCRDPRYTAGSKLIGERAAVDIYASLCEQTRQQYGDSHIETAPAYNMYGKALFWLAQRNTEEATLTTAPSSKQDARLAAAQAAERRLKSSGAGTTTIDEDSKPAASHPKLMDATKEEEEEEEPDKPPEMEDVLLALELMENAWSILDEHSDTTEKYQGWIKHETPRVLSGIADILSALSRHADATDAYLRALERRQGILEGITDACLDQLIARRQIVELNVLIAEELLACDPNQDVVTTESQTALVKAGSVVEYARGYYDKARDELQETVLLLGQLSAQDMVVDTLEIEKENVCFAATMVMGVGTTLARMDEEEEQAANEPTAKKLKER